MKCHWNVDNNVFEAWERGKHSTEQMVPLKRGLSAAVFNKVNMMSNKHMIPADIIKALRDDEDVEKHLIPKSSQISSRNRSIKSDTSDSSFYRLQTFNALSEHLESKLLTIQESYDALGIIF